MKFIERTTPPELDNKFYNSNENIYYANGYGMPNCPPYVWGRLWEVTGEKPKIGIHNACDWFEEAKRLGYKVGTVPKLGAVICWGGAGNNPYGHIGFVEYIDKDNNPRISESSSSGLYWNNQLVAYASDNYTHPTSANHYPFQGFIYCGIDFDNDVLYNDVLYRVQVGAYYILNNAKAKAKELKSKGFNTYIVKYGQHYKVQVGAYRFEENARYMLNEIIKAGYEAFITTQEGKPVEM